MTAPSSPVEGIFLGLRPVEPSDAAYILQLRTDPRYSTHLSPVTASVDDQRAWIERYKQREAEGAEIYFIIERKDGRPCGTVRLYDFTDDSFTWGSWILDEAKPPKAALESALLSLGYGFDTLGRSEALIDVRRDNQRALGFYRRFGMTETGVDDRDVYFTYLRSTFENDRPMHLAVLRRAAEAAE